MEERPALLEADEQAQSKDPLAISGKKKKRLEAVAAEVAARSGSAQAMGWVVLSTGEIDPRQLVMREDLNSRHYEDDVTEMVTSLLETGQQSPICVRLGSESGTYEVIFGNRRTRAALEILQAGLRDDYKLRYELVDVTDAMAFDANVSENHWRKSLSDIDYAHILAKQKEMGRSQGEIAKRMGKSDSWVTRTLRLLQLSPEEQHMVHLYAVTEGKKGIAPSVAIELLEKPPESRSQEIAQLTQETEGETGVDAEFIGARPEGAPRKKKRLTRAAIRQQRREREEGKPFYRGKMRTTSEIRAPFEAVVKGVKAAREMTPFETFCSVFIAYIAGKVGERAMMNALQAYGGKAYGGTVKLKKSGKL